MVRLSKTRKGFTLIEMVLVIAIVVTISVVVWYSVSAYLGKAKSATSMMKKHIDAVESVTAEIPV